MAILSIYIPDSGVERVYDAICDHYRYQPTVQNPNGGQSIITWSDSVENNSGLLPIASGQGYIGPLPGTIQTQAFYSTNSGILLDMAIRNGYTGSGIPDPIVPPFISSSGIEIQSTIPTVPPFVDGISGILGVVTGVTPQIIPNPETKEVFTNGVLRGFLAEHTKVYELDLARRQAEIAASGAGNVPVDDGSTATVYDYDMVCLQPAKSQYDALASVIAPGNTFNIPLSANGNNPATHYGLQAGITDTARQQLLVLELAGGTTTSGVQTMFYTRCDPQTHIAQSTNISGYDIVGKVCSFSGLLNHLGLKEIAG